MKTFIIVLLVCLVISSPIRADMYKWEDENGVITFKDAPPPPSKKKRNRRIKVYRDGASSATAAPATPQAAPRSAAGKKQRTGERFSGVIEVFVTEWCPVCKEAVRYLSERGYQYVSYDIEKDGGARKRYRELGGHGVPLILVGSNRMSGFSAALLEKYVENE